MTFRLGKRKSGLGFTVIEMLVVMCIVAIVSVFVVPGFNKLYKDFCLKKTLSDTDMLLNTCRSYYLIANELPADAGCDYIPIEVVDFLSAFYVDKNQESSHNNKKNYKMTISPYGDGLAYDFQNWIFLNYVVNEPRVMLAIGDPSGNRTNPWLDFYLKKFTKKYPCSEVRIYGADVLIEFPEIPKSDKLDSIDKNRWY